MKDYYETLGVARDADAGALKSAYRKLAMKFHPDRNPGDTEAETRFKEINEAYEVLKDDQKRAAYDRFGHDAFANGAGGPGAADKADMDALRPVVWNIGMPAQHGTPEALDLIRRIILASASIPVAFPPVVINMPYKGRVYQELHADGGVTNQVFLFPPDLDWAGFIGHFALTQKPDLYIIRNDRMAADFESTPARLIPLAKRSIDSLIRTQGIGDLYRLYVTAKENDFDYFLAHVPNDFQVETTELFDPDYMRPLFHLGYEQGRRGGCWYSLPPGMALPGTDSGSAGCRPGAGSRAK